MQSHHVKGFSWALLWFQIWPITIQYSIYVFSKIFYKFLVLSVLFTLKISTSTVESLEFTLNNTDTHSLEYRNYLNPHVVRWIIHIVHMIDRNPLQSDGLLSTSFLRSGMQHLKLFLTSKLLLWVATRSQRVMMQPCTTHLRQTSRTLNWLCPRLERPPTGRCVLTPVWILMPRQR